MIRLHVLLVDGDPESRETIAASLMRDPFFVVRSCASGRDAVAAVAEWQPDMMLVDAALPDMDGDALLARLRADRRTAPIPVLVMTAREGMRERERLKRRGAGEVLAKPVDLDGLAAMLRRLVAVEGILRPARGDFFERLKADARALSACRPRPSRTPPEPALRRINQIAHSLAGAGGIYGFAGITCASAELSLAAERTLAGKGRPVELEHALDRLLERIAPA